MSAAAVITLGLWFGSTALAGWLWLPARIGPWPAARESRRGRVLVLAALVLLLAASAILASIAAPLAGPWRWVGVLLGGGSAVQAGAAQLLVLIGLLAAETLAVWATVELVARGDLVR